MNTTNIYNESVQPMRQKTKNIVAFSILMAMRGLISSFCLFVAFTIMVLRTTAYAEGASATEFWETIGRMLGSNLDVAARQGLTAFKVLLAVPTLLIAQTVIEHLSFRRCYYVGGPVFYQTFWIVSYIIWFLVMC